MRYALHCRGFAEGKKQRLALPTFIVKQFECAIGWLLLFSSIWASRLALSSRLCDGYTFVSSVHLIKMTTLVPRGPYSQAELDKLYPRNLELQLVQVILRHGERAPVGARFQNAGLAPYWPYCNGIHISRFLAKLILI